MTQGLLEAPFLGFAGVAGELWRLVPTGDDQAMNRTSDQMTLEMTQVDESQAESGEESEVVRSYS